VTDRDFVKSFTAACAEAVYKIRLGSLQVFRYSRSADQAKREAWAYIDRFVDQALEMRENGDHCFKSDGGAPYIFLEELAKETQDRYVLRDQILGILLASRDTTSSLLGNMFFELSRKPNVWAKLRVEVASLDGATPTADSLKNMPYLRWCINECESYTPTVL
jgi:cytochrome P450